ncbi:unnamed protein product (macronuclear) [Paramecium tetraurelia]|uniref:Uncharacterized protein n=1 Tax=Paramecium tetraurelia TaxID=5888 RepID=A0BID2_PARTE|nr:uncharacterized protein GSPATT00004671001 [Paramecium tetraurelia]CAK58299.1 unnamed protein product [Paramecium tetraurelia]|eukprot:XP_001425697.1 hypothetical protein (macronuclear) [Paramecium tetraurelia strain d4-2]
MQSWSWLIQPLLQTRSQEDKKEVVIKQIHKKQLQPFFNRCSETKSQYLSSVIISTFTHIIKQQTNIIQLLNFANRQCANQQSVDILQIIKQQGSLLENTVIIYVLQIGEALKYRLFTEISNLPISQSIKESQTSRFFLTLQSIKTDFELKKDNSRLDLHLYIYKETLLKNEYNHKTNFGPLVYCFLKQFLVCTHMYSKRILPIYLMEMDDLVRKLQKISKGLYLDVQTSVLRSFN